MTAREVFVSYSKRESDIALAVVSHLEANDMCCWVAPRNVPPGTEWAEQIVAAIARAYVMVLVFSSSANGSPQVRREVERAVHRRLRVLTFRVENVHPTGSLEYFLSSQHWLDAFPPPMEPHYARLGAYVKTLLGGEPGADASETPPGLRRLSPVEVLDAAALQRLETELARFIGPVAGHLVNRAALHSSGVEELLAQLGREIESETERRQFIAAARESLRTH